ncbi:MAG: PorT family protein [Thermoflavifilum sp.]|nr:PorT family protein [Thermoflavifilum sp.]
MQKVQLWYLLRVLRLQKHATLVLSLCLLQSLSGRAQFFANDIDNADYYFGISLGYAVSTFNLDPSPFFLKQDSIQVVEPLNNGGLTMGFRATMRLTDHIDLRFNPALIFTDRNIRYTIKDSSTVDKKIESVLLNFPLHAVLNSDRFGNFRVYAFTGIRFADDVSTNATARKAEDMIQLSKYDLGYELGFGFHIYFPAFVLSPEVKISNGFRNIFKPTPGLIYSDVIQRMKSHMVVFSLNFE